ncbi:hypothetical protein KSZ_51460 [Dictyobacter formicarum]|uniref:Uncharacterized protein n=1 Tax=Dictyobacter formicarum TaxID=2778368 RepID=A0ABQ3VLN6_9CHLR|nr:hypothetical protein KSZ_51460 [Dictyobacter formicarum]
MDHAFLAPPDALVMLPKHGGSRASYEVSAVEVVGLVGMSHGQLARAVCSGLLEAHTYCWRSGSRRQQVSPQT